MIDSVELLRDLIRFDTTNPPGNEEACVAFVEACFATTASNRSATSKRLGDRI